MRTCKIIVLNILFVFILSVGVSAESKYIIDDAKVLKQDTINTLETNLGKIEKNTDITIKFNIIRSLDKKDIDSYAREYAKTNIKGDQYILFVTATEDRKNKLLVGEKVNNVLSKTDIETIVASPNTDFKAGNFDQGIMKIGKALDLKVTTKAVSIGKAEVTSDSYSSSVSPKTNWFKIIGFILILGGIGFIIFIFIKKKINKDYEDRKKKFAHDNNLDEYLDKKSNDTFRSSNVNSEPKKEKVYEESYPNHKSNYNSNYNNNVNHTKSKSTYSEPVRASRTVTNNYNTTVVSNDDNFVEGVILGSMLSESNHKHHEEEHRYEEPEKKSYSEPEKTYSSNNWDTDSNSSNWDSSPSSSSNDDSSSSNWDSDSGSSSYDD